MSRRRSTSRASFAVLGAAGALALLAGCASLPRPFGGRAPATWGFTGPWDPRSTASALRHAGALDAVVTGWIALDSLTGAPEAVYPDTLRQRLGGARAMALVTTYTGGAFRPQTIRLLAADAPRLAAAAHALADQLAAGGYRGAVLDFEGMKRDDLPALVAVARAFATEARARGVGPMSLAIPALDTAGYPARALAGAVDALLVMLYDEHWSTSPPGPIAEPTWVSRALALRVAEAGPSALVAALPLYGYQWPTPADSTPALRVGRAIGYADALRLAGDAGVPLERDPSTQTLHAQKPGAWELWVTDAVLLRQLEEIVARSGVRTVALWRLGLEDPGVW